MVEGARLLSEYTVKSCIVGSNPILSATFPRELVLRSYLRPDFLVVFEGYAGGGC